MQKPPPGKIKQLSNDWFISDANAPETCTPIQSLYEVFMFGENSP